MPRARGGVTGASAVRPLGAQLQVVHAAAGAMQTPRLGVLHNPAELLLPPGCHREEVQRSNRFRSRCHQQLPNELSRAGAVSRSGWFPIRALPPQCKRRLQRLRV